MDDDYEFEYFSLWLGNGEIGASAIRDRSKRLDEGCIVTECQEPMFPLFPFILEIVPPRRV